MVSLIYSTYKRRSKAMGTEREKKRRKRQWQKRILAAALVCLLVIGLIPSDVLKVSAADDSNYSNETAATTEEVKNTSEVAVTETTTEVTTEVTTEGVTVTEVTTETATESGVTETTTEEVTTEEVQEVITENSEPVAETANIPNEKATGSTDNAKQAALREKLDAYWAANEVFCEAYDACNGHWDDEAEEWVNGSVWKFMETCDSDVSVSDSELTALHETAEADYQTMKSLLPTLSSACEAVKAAFADETLTDSDLSGVYDPNGGENRDETITFSAAKEAVESDYKEIEGNFEWLTNEWVSESEMIELEDGEPQCGFAGHFITQKAYENINWWDYTEGQEVMYWVHATTAQEVIDKLLSLVGKVFYEGGTAFTIQNTGYIRVTTSFSPFVQESVDNASAAQYITTPSGEDGISGVIIASAYDHYRVPLENADGDIQYYEVYDFVNESTGDVIQMVPYKGWTNADTGEWVEEYRIVEGDYQNGFKFTADTTTYADGEYGAANGDYGYIWIEGDIHNENHWGDGHEGTFNKQDWNELHVDATTAVKIIGDFVDPGLDENGNKKANLFLGFYKDSDITSMLTEDVDLLEFLTITSASIGTIAQRVGTTNAYLTVQELKTTTNTEVTEDSFLKKNSVSFENGTGGKSLRDKMNIEDIIQSNEEVKRAIITGTPLDISLNVKSVSADNKELSADIEKIAAQAKKDAVTKIQYLDFNLSYKIGNYSGRVTETNGMLTITIDIPEGFVTAGKIPVIYRCHNGVVEKVKSEYKDGKLTFYTDKFSTYGIAVEDETADAVTTQVVTSSKTSNSDASPKTGDAVNMELAFLLLLLSAAMLVFAVESKKTNK
jgi:hypothetical protein